MITECPYCGKICKTSQGLSGHIQWKHKNISPANPSSSNIHPSNRYIYTKKFKCQYCYHKFLERHIIECEECGCLFCKWCFNKHDCDY
jgi:hypothetical protein